MSVKFTKIYEEAIMPKKLKPTDAGFTLYAMTDTEIPPGTRAWLTTGVAVQFPPGSSNLIFASL